MGMDEAKLAFLRAFPTAPTDGSRHLAFMKGFHAATRWRKWPEEKPEADGWYLVSNESCVRAYEAYYRKGFRRWESKEDYIYNTITAWQPLPAPYQPERKEEP